MCSGSCNSIFYILMSVLSTSGERKMKIVNLEEFRKLPKGTLYMKYEPYICIFGDLCAKGETLGHDFLMENIACEIDANDCDDFSSKLHEAEENGASVAMEFDCTSRDGAFDKKQLFATYEKNDIEMLQDKLKRCAESAYT